MAPVLLRRAALGACGMVFAGALAAACRSATTPQDATEKPPHDATADSAASGSPQGGALTDARTIATADGTDGEGGAGEDDPRGRLRVPRTKRQHTYGGTI